MPNLTSTQNPEAEPAPFFEFKNMLLLPEHTENASENTLPTEDSSDENLQF